jgi:hypothetical protein
MKARALLVVFSVLSVVAFITLVLLRFTANAGVPPAPQALLSAPRQAQAESCDRTRWDHVYNPQRLTVLAECIAATGTIVDATHGKRRDGVRHEADGDTHGWLKLDPGQDSLLDAGNMSNEEGNLVFEIVCRFSVKQTDAVGACSHYSDTLALPLPGTHVRMTGTWVRDNNHAKWNEIHPVTSVVSDR